MLDAIVIGAPLLFAILILLCPKDVCKFPAVLGAVACCVLPIVFVLQNLGGIYTADLSEYYWLLPTIFMLDLAIGAYLLYVSFKQKSPLLFLISVLQCTAAVFHHFTGDEEIIPTTLYADELSYIMLLIIGVVGGAIALFTVGYMKKYHKHNTDICDRTKFFLVVMFVFISAMFLLVLANQLSLLLLCWEITSLASFLMIGYTRTQQAKQNSLLAIVTNGLGGLFFTIAIIFASEYGIYDMQTLLNNKIDYFSLNVIVLFMSIAALTKSAQMPFSKWLLGAMVAPTPSSALLHSSTMVKAGVFLLLRLSPLFGDEVGITVTFVGAVTFFSAAMLAVSQSDAKRVLAYSTISNLGLIVACAGISTPEALWAAFMLIIFHAIAKALLFLAVGETENRLGSRDIEDMDGLIGKSPLLAYGMLIGIAGMFIAPFGMLISKWAAMKAFIEVPGIWGVLLIILVAYGSTVTLFFWTKWLGKLIARSKHDRKKYKYGAPIAVPLVVLSILTILVCVSHPIVSQKFALPYLDRVMGIDTLIPIPLYASIIMIAMMAVIVLLPIILVPIYSKQYNPSFVFLAGENRSNETFMGAMGTPQKVELRNSYLSEIFGEKVLLGKSIILSAVILLIGTGVVVGGAL